MRLKHFIPTLLQDLGSSKSPSRSSCTHQYTPGARSVPGSKPGTSFPAHIMNYRRYICAFLFSCLITVTAQAFTTTAKQAILIDAQTGKVLFEKNADQLMYPSSLTKIMTVYMLFEQLQMGRVSLDDMFPVSKAAWRKKGSRMFVEVDSLVRVEDLLRGIIVQSGNDASIVVAEGLTGSEAVFATEMSRRAHELGATNTTFKNATGWPDPLHVTTARDLAV